MRFSRIIPNGRRRVLAASEEPDKQLSGEAPQEPPEEAPSSSDKEIRIVDVDEANKDLVEGAKDVLIANDIMPGRGKRPLAVAVVGDEVVGAILYGLRPWNRGMEASFDAAVLPEYRGRVGLALLNRAVRQAEQDLKEGGAIRLWVANPRLVPILERRFDFEIERQDDDGTAHLIKEY